MSILTGSVKHSERSIFNSLQSVFPSPAHILLSQVRNGTGYARKTTRTADALVMSVYPSRGLWLAGVEIKTYLGDWKRELADGDKAEAMAKYCHYWYVAAPEGLIPKNELPDSWGLIEASKKTCIAVKATRKEPLPIDMLLLGSILRNVAESSVPMNEVETLANEKAEKLAEHRATELKHLREDIRAFEEASGVSLKEPWKHGNISKAVKVIVESNLLHHWEWLKKLRLQADMVVGSCDKILSQLPENESL